MAGSALRGWALDRKTSRPLISSTFATEIERFFYRRSFCVGPAECSQAIAHDFPCDRAAGGVEGLKLAKELRPTAITLDVMMPDLDGWSVLAALRKDPELADIPVIMVTIVDEHRRGIALFRAFSRRRVMANVGAERLLKIAAEPSPELRIPNAAAQTGPRSAAVGARTA
jgi:CheY-like chemotaxis protein